MHRIFVLIAAAAALAACATAEGYRQQVAPYVGASADRLMLDWGSPVDIAPMSEGREMWTYYFENETTSGGYTYDKPMERKVERVDD